MAAPAESAEAAGRLAAARRAVERIADPEIPVLTLADLGILRGLRMEQDRLVVTITPTYSGCPAMTVIAMTIRDTLLRAGHAAVEVETVLAPAWTTDWLSAEGRAKLRRAGIAPPAESGTGTDGLFADGPAVCCPRCGAGETEAISRFGSTACKALYRCLHCREPFDYFKCL